MKYNWGIIGHEKQLNLLEQDISSGNISHAYLLIGPNSIGKYTVAKKIAGILQCENDFCHECSTCIQIEKGSHIDTIEFKDDKESLKIEEVRALVERLNMTGQSKYKIVLLQSVERMTVEASNSFLKILEEPPKNTIFIMTANNIRLILPTVISRVRVVKFEIVSANYLTEKLKTLYADRTADEITKASLLALGKTGKAIKLMENPEVFSDYMALYHKIKNFIEVKNVADRFAYVEEIVEDDSKIDLFFNLLKTVLRTKILEGDANIERNIDSVLKIYEASVFLKKNVNSRLVLENLMLSL
jgi:DNA polymerase-3 subunit delta'